jgi:hypothetical protein
MGVDLSTYRSRIGSYYCKAASKSKLKTEISSDKCDCETYTNVNDNDSPPSRVTSDDINELRTVVMQLKNIFVENSKLLNENKSSEVKSDRNMANTDSNKHCENVKKSFICECQPTEKVSNNKYQSNSVTNLTYEIKNFIDEVTENDHVANSLVNVIKVINSFIAKHHLKVENCPELCLLIHVFGISKNIECTVKNAGVPLFKQDQVYNGTIKLSHAGYILQYFFSNILGRSCHYQDDILAYQNKNMFYWQLHSIHMGLSANEFNKAIVDTILNINRKDDIESTLNVEFESIACDIVHVTNEISMSYAKQVQMYNNNHYQSESLLIQSGDVETNPGPLMNVNLDDLYPYHIKYSLKGNLHQASPLFSGEYGGNQCVCNAIWALCELRLKVSDNNFPIDASVIDEILLKGDKLYGNIIGLGEIRYLRINELPNKLPAFSSGPVLYELCYEHTVAENVTDVCWHSINTNNIDVYCMCKMS